jgi:hypothetical protein
LESVGTDRTVPVHPAEYPRRKAGFSGENPPLGALAWDIRGTSELRRHRDREPEPPAPAPEEPGAAGSAAPVAEPDRHADLLAGAEPAGQRALAADIAATYGNQHLQRVARAVLARQETAEATLVQQLDDELDDTFVDEELCISLIARMNPAERASILNDTYRDKLASALDEDEMLRVVQILGPPLATKLAWIRAGTWLSSWEIDWVDIKPLIVAAPQTERDVVRTDAWRDFFVSVCGNADMAEAVILLGGTQAEKQAWMDEEGTTTNEYLDALVRMQVFESGSVTHTSARDADSAIAAHLGELVKGAKADGRQIAGMVAVVGDDDFNVAGINHYGASVWATKSLNGFVDSNDRVWIHKDRGNAGTMIHEGLHKWSKEDVLDLSQPLNEGVTEYFTRKVCAALTPPAAVGRTNYQNNWAVSTSLVSLVGETTVAAAYFDGDTDALEDAYVAKKSDADWTAFLTACSANDWTTAATLVTP